MNNFAKYTILKLSGAFPLNGLINGEYPPLIPLYHTVEKKQPEYIVGYHVKNTKAFKKDLDLLLKHYKPASLREIIAESNNNKKLFHLTFDDGLKSCSDTIAPILREKGIPATFFVNPDFVERNDLFHRFIYEIARKKGLKPASKLKQYTNKKQLNAITLEQTDLRNSIEVNTAYMNMHDLMQLTHEGFTIGAHGMDHPEFYTISENEQYRQISESIAWIDKHLGPSIKAFAFPFTDHGIRNSLLKRVYSENLVDVTFGTAGLKYDCYPGHFQRIPMEKKQYYSATRILKYEHLYFRIRKLFNKNVVKRDD